MDGIFLDIETTGLDSFRHYPIEIAFKVVNLSTGELKASYESIIKQSEEAWAGKDPHSIEINGFTWERVQTGKEPAIVGQEMFALLCGVNIQRGSAVFVCQNPSFDRGFFNQLIPVLTQEQKNWPYHWLDLASMFWAMQIAPLLRTGKTPEKIALSKNSIAENYQLPTEESPHRAMQGVEHLMLCYQAVFGIDFANFYRRSS
jgi:DNA polymerase-3 subunit epsilon/oligoribonuclease